MTEDEDCPGAIFAPELAEECKIFTKPCDQLGKLGEIDKMLEYIGLDKVFEKLTAPFDKFCKVNSASASCEKLCELTSLDPNGKFGPGDNNLQKYVNHIRDANYTIMFENVPSASAPAAYVEIRDTIDKTVFDINTIQTGVLGWGDSLVFMESNRSSISLLRDLRPLRPNMLRIDVEVDTLAGIITWKFWTVDTIKLQLTTDPSEGFLPPNTDGVSGLGFVTFTIKPNAGVTSGSVLTNKATIVFDQNAPIITPLWEYRVDTTRPQSQVSPLPAITNTSSFLVSWSGTDSHSGINEYSVFVSKDDSLYKQWKSLTTLTADTFHGEFGHSYKFFSVALDKAGNFEEAPINPILNPDAVTNIQWALPLNLISFTIKKTLDGKKVDLNWKTVQEVSVSHFEIQRRTNGNDFITIGRIRATNNFNGASYVWQDSSPLPGDNYYRLRMVDIDSTIKFSLVRLIKFSTEKVNTSIPDYNKRSDFYTIRKIYCY